MTDEYRLVVGERGNEQGHIIATDATTDEAARAALATELAAYGGDGWGRVEIEVASGEWERLDTVKPRTEHDYYY